MYDKNTPGKVNAEWYDDISSCPECTESPKGRLGYEIGLLETSMGGTSRILLDDH